MKPESHAIITRLLDAVNATGHERLALQATLTQLVLDVLKTEAQPTRHWQRWTPEEDDLIRRHFPAGRSAGVQAAGVNRSLSSIRNRAGALGVTVSGSGSHWTPEEDRIVTEQFGQVTAQRIVQALADAGFVRSKRAVYRRAEVLGLARVRASRADTERVTVRAMDRVLADLLAADRQDMPLDSTSLTPHDQGVLRRLRQENLARHIGDSLWRPTLLALAHERGAA